MNKPEKEIILLPFVYESDGINQTKINKSRKRISNPGGKLKNRSKAKGIGKKR